MWTTAKKLILPALLGAILAAVPATSNEAFAWGSGGGGHGGGGHGGGGHGGGGHGGGGHGGGGNGGGNGGGEGSGRVGSLIHDCSEGSYQFWCRNKQFKVRKGGGHYRASRKRVRMHYTQSPVSSRYRYVPTQKVVVYHPQVVYQPQVVYEAKVVHRARTHQSHDYHVRPSHGAAPAPYRYEGPVTTTEETVHREYDGHGVLVYRPVPRGTRYKRRAADRAHHRARNGHYGHVKRKHSRKRHYKRRAAHTRYRRHKARTHVRYSSPAVPPAHYSAHQPPSHVYVVRRRRVGPIHRKIPLFGSRSSHQHQVVRVRRRAHKYRKYRKHRTCSPCGHVVYKRRKH